MALGPFTVTYMFDSTISALGPNWDLPWPVFLSPFKLEGALMTFEVGDVGPPLI